MRNSELTYSRYLLVSGHAVGWGIAAVLALVMPEDWAIKVLLLLGITLLTVTASALGYRRARRVSR